MSVKGKKLLVLGGTTASLDVVKQAKALGVYTIVTDDAPAETRVSKQLADESALVSTTDLDGLAALVKEKQIDGVFCGPSEFNIENMIRFCESYGLPCYATMAQWKRCSNKDVFKQYCLKCNVDCPQDYQVTADMREEALRAIDYPIILKPVDGSSSAGITTCYDESMLAQAYEKAMNASNCKRIVAEKYIESNGEKFNFKYLVKDGEAYPFLLLDSYVVDPYKKRSLISGFAITPSRYAQYFIENMDANIRALIRELGLKNGVAFFQGIPSNGKIYIHEMGFRISGGLTYKITEPLYGINDLHMMIRYALGEPLFDDAQVKAIDLIHSEKCAAQLTIPLHAGTIAEIRGLEEVKSIPQIVDFLQYYPLGGEIAEKSIGTQGQHFGRISMVGADRAEIFAIVDHIQNTLKVFDENGALMNDQPFDLRRVTANV